MNAHINPALSAHNRTPAVLAVGFPSGKRPGGGTPAGMRPPAVIYPGKQATAPNKLGPRSSATSTDIIPAAQAARNKARPSGIIKC